MESAGDSGVTGKGKNADKKREQSAQASEQALKSPSRPKSKGEPAPSGGGGGGVPNHQREKQTDHRPPRPRPEGAEALSQKEKGERPQKPKPARDADSTDGQSATPNVASGTGGGKQQTSTKPAAGAASRDISGAGKSSASRLAVFDHLPRKKALDTESIDSDRSLHPAIVKLGALYRSGAVQDDDDRVCALFVAFCNVVKDYKTPPKKNLSWDLDKHVRLQVKTA